VSEQSEGIRFHRALWGVRKVEPRILAGLGNTRSRLSKTKPTPSFFEPSRKPILHPGENSNPIISVFNSLSNLMVSESSWARRSSCPLHITPAHVQIARNNPLAQPAASELGLVCSKNVDIRQFLLQLPLNVAQAG